MTKIQKIYARELIDSRGNPTIEVDVIAGGKLGRAIVPSGASTGVHEALELRDKGKRYHGKGVLKAVSNVNKVIAPKLIGREVTQQKEIDNFMIELDGTKNKSNLGANSILGISMACSKAASLVQNKHFFQYYADLFDNKKLVLPTPFMNIINGGAHADNNLDFQEYMIVPQGKNFKESIRIGCEVYHELKSVIKKKYGPSQVNVGDEGGFSPNMKTHDEPLEVIMKAVESLGYEKEMRLAMDVAASEFYKNGKYGFEGKYITPDKLIEIYDGLVKRFPIISIEDPLNEEDFADFSKLLTIMKPKNINVVGDDLLCTSVDRIRTALKNNSCSALLLKVNQVGSITESMKAAKLALANNWDVMVSHRSGETEDSFIADFSVGLGTGQLKTGAPCRGERTAKYNQLLRIEEEINNQ